MSQLDPTANEYSLPDQYTTLCAPEESVQVSVTEAPSGTVTFFGVNIGLPRTPETLKSF